MSKGRPITGKRIFDSHGYVKIYAPTHPLADSTGRVYEHRMVVHDAGIAIPIGSEVHHINGDRADNRLENLEVLSRDAHRQHHDAQRQPKFQNCVVCGKTYQLTPSKKARSQTCGGNSDPCCRELNRRAAFAREARRRAAVLP